MSKIPALPLSSADEAHLAWLDTIQGNIVRGHGREFVRLVFCRFDAVTPQNLRLLPEAVDAGLATSARAQLAQKRVGVDEPFFSLALTEGFFRHCNFEAGLPPESMGLPFYSGAASRLGDAEDWDPEYRANPHGMWLLAHRCADQLDPMQRRIAELLARCGARMSETVENGIRWSDDPQGKILREPFGFRDGISSTNFFAAPAETAPEARVGLDRLLISDGPHAGGTFLVMRKLDQNVRAFRAFEAKLTQAYGDKLPARDSGALLVGRNRDGTPLATLCGEDLNRFDFRSDPQGTRCPFHAHIRKANPRDTGPQIKDAAHILTSQFVRRSMVYDEDGQLPLRASPDYREGDGIDGRVGLFFMGYMRHIEEQFERMNRTWFGDPHFPTAATGQADPIIQPPLAPPGTWSWGEQSISGMTRFVTARGGLYLYVPSMTWLRHPAAASGPASPG